MARDVPDHRQSYRGCRAVHFRSGGVVIPFPTEAFAHLGRELDSARLRTGRLFAAVRRPSEAAAGINALSHLIVRGGITIQTPAAGTVMIATTVQPDGDILTFIDKEVLTWPSTRQSELKVEHFCMLRRSLAQLLP